MKQRLWISLGAIVLGASTLTIGYAASKSGEEGMSCERMMSAHMGRAGMNHQGVMGNDHGIGKEGRSMMDRNHMGMMGSQMAKECEEMMRTHGMRATGSQSAKPTAPAN